MNEKHEREKQQKRDWYYRNRLPASILIDQWIDAQELIEVHVFNEVMRIHQVVLRTEQALTMPDGQYHKLTIKAVSNTLNVYFRHTTEPEVAKLIIHVLCNLCYPRVNRIIRQHSLMN